MRWCFVKRRTGITIGVVAVLIIGVLLGTGTRGGMGRFSPDTLEFQTRSEFTILNGAIPLYRSNWETSENELLTYIQKEGYVQPIATDNPRWETLFH